MTSKNEFLLKMFTDYCKFHPEERFWQALCNWSHYVILARTRYNPPHEFDTFNLEDDYRKWPR